MDLVFVLNSYFLPFFKSKINPLKTNWLIKVISKEATAKNHNVRNKSNAIGVSVSFSNVCLFRTIEAHVCETIKLSNVKHTSYIILDSVRNDGRGRILQFFETTDAESNVLCGGVE